MLKAVYNTQDRPGPYEKSIYLFSNSAVQPRNVIILKGEVKAALAAIIEVVPKKIRLGPIKKDSLQKIQLEVSNRGDQDLRLNEIRGEIMKTTLKSNLETSIIRPGASIMIDLEFYRNMVGPFAEVIFFDSNARNTLKGQYAVMVLGECIP